MRKYVKDFFDKAVEKDKERQQRRAERKAKEGMEHKSPMDEGRLDDRKEDDGAKSDDDQDMAVSEDEEKPHIAPTTPATPLDQLSLEGLKRKRDQLLEEGMNIEDESTPNKLIKSETPPPPPPPPAPVNGVYPDVEEASDAAVDDAVDSPMDDPLSTMENSNIGPPSPPLNPSTNGNPTGKGVEDGAEEHDVDGRERQINSEDHGYPPPVQV